MASPDARSIDLPIQVLGGKVSQFDPQALPQGASPFNRDVIFSGANAGGEVSVGGVGTRPGMQSLYAAFAGNPAINYIRTFVDSSGNPHQLLLDSLGVVRDDFPEATFTQIGTVVAFAFAQSDTYAGREWLAIGDGKFGIDIPRQYDGTFFDRVSQVGPGAAPGASDENVVVNLNGSPTGAIEQTAVIAIGGLTEVGFLVTVKTLSIGPLGDMTYWKVGDQVQIVNAGVAGYNGTFTIVALLADGVSFQYVNTVSGLAASGGGTFGTGGVNSGVAFFEFASGGPYSVGQLVTSAGVAPAGFNASNSPVRHAVPAGAAAVAAFIGNAVFGLGAGGGGTLTNAGNISAGLHQVSVCFVTEENYITCPAPPNSWTAGGSKRVALSTIATGPPNIKKRIVIFTPVITSPASTGPFFYFPSVTPAGNTSFPTMVIPDNVTTSGTFDFIDSVLQSATAASNLFNLLELGECSSTVTYSERTFWTGERNKVNAAGGGGGFNNLTFDGGFTPFQGPGNVPLGWTADGANFGGGFIGNLQVWGNSWGINSNGGAAITGSILQTAFQDYLGVPIIQPNVAYKVRARIALSGAAFTQGTLHIRLFSASGGINAGLDIALANLTATFLEYIGTLTAGIATPPSDLLLRVYADGTPIGAGQACIDNIEVFPTNNAINRTLVRASYAFQPEAFDGVTGLLIVGKDNGQAVRGAFKLLDKKLYFVKERSLYGSQDDGANEPSLWSIDQISATVGTPSVRGFDLAGEAWAVIAAHDGLYIFWGAEPIKISQEIQADWDTINWNAGQTIWVVVDSQNKRIHVAAPTGSSLVPNQEFVMDYSQLNDAEEIAANPQAHYAIFNPTNVVAPGRARKWTIWNFSSNSGALTLRADGSYHLLRGNAVGNGKVYDQVATQTSDDGVAINSQYQTYYFPNGMEEQELQQILGGHRRLFKFLTGYVFGSGVMTWSAHGQQDNRIVALSSLTLSNPAKWDFEKNVNFPSERSSLIFATNAVGAWFHVSKLKPTIAKDTMLVRGVA